MAIISFAYTTDSLLAGEKTVTRRRWKESHMENFQRWYDEGTRTHDAWDRLPIQGGKRVGKIRLTGRPYWEPLGEMPEEDLEKEGVPAESLEEFFAAWEIGLHEEVAVVRFELTETYVDQQEYRPTRM